MWMDGQRTKTNPITSPEQSAILQLVQEINCSITRKTAPPPWQPLTSRETNVLTKFHENWAKNVTSKKNAPPTGGHVFSPIWTIFELVRHINRTNRKTAPPTGGHLNKDWALNVTSTTFTSFFSFFDLHDPVSNSIEISNRTNLLTKFHEDRTINVASRVFKNICGRTNNGQRPVTKAHLS
ncbi:hypothetical protein DPMN_003649 [Dreissena polymorpha]|uniref:Uncharacterized protein n=1 Tax=Dreissena polymorpha TaxID=45954 RepID=A0A9D4MNP4_DREPO|nr:hypothetical protein DPMN_003649 [Dreissena polymorpha]